LRPIRTFQTVSRRGIPGNRLPELPILGNFAGV
jgi:hypothetical protein